MSSFSTIDVIKVKFITIEPWHPDSLVSHWTKNIRSRLICRMKPQESIGLLGSVIEQPAWNAVFLLSVVGMPSYPVAFDDCNQARRSNFILTRFSRNRSSRSRSSSTIWI